MAHITRMLAQLFRGNITTERALHLIATDKAPYPVRRIMPVIIDHVQNGGTLTEAFVTQRRALPDEFLELLKLAKKGVGELVALQKSALEKAKAA